MRLSHARRSTWLTGAGLSFCSLLAVCFVVFMQSSSSSTTTWRANGDGAPLIVSTEISPGQQVPRVLDYRSVDQEVYAPQGFAACPAAAFQCWLPLTKTVDCRRLFDDYLHTLATHVPVFPAPKDLPVLGRKDFLLQGYTHLTSFYFPQLSHAPDAEVPVWTDSTIQDFTQKAKDRQPMGLYGADAFKVFQALDCHPIKGLRGAVFGTEVPWLESILFVFGAQHVVTVEFRTTISHLPNHQVVKPLDWVRGMRNGSIPAAVDFAFVFSSWEHDGLGRYGDPVDPWGDVKAMQRASCYVKPGGLLFFGAPSGGTDQLMYNAHRIYGPVRLPLLTANWEVLGIYDNTYKVGVCGKATCENVFDRWKVQAPVGHYIFQPVAVLRNLRTTPCNLS